MRAFQVWIRPLGDSYRLRVTAKSDAQWLRAHLDSLTGSANCEQLSCHPSGFYTFCVPYTDAASRTDLNRILREMPEVEVMSQPA